MNNHHHHHYEFRVVFSIRQIFFYFYERSQQEITCRIKPSLRKPLKVKSKPLQKSGHSRTAMKSLFFSPI